jgi:hypothetical protein
MNQQNIIDKINNEFSNDIFPLDVIFINLENISNISVGDKLIHNNKYITIDSSYVKSVTRWMYGFNRFTILDFINKILDESYKHLQILRNNNDDASGILWVKLISKLKTSALGLTKLRQTYSYDEEFIEKLDVIIKKILKNT